MSKNMPKLLINTKTFNRLLNGILANMELTSAIRLFMNSIDFFSSYGVEGDESLVKCFLTMWFNPELDPETKKLIADFNKSQMKHFKKL